MFKNMKIGMKLGVGFFLVLALLITVSTISLMRISDITAVTKIIVDDRMPMISMADETKAITLEIGRAVRNLILSTDKSFEREQLDAITKLRTRNGELAEKMKSMIKTARGHELFEKTEESRNKLGDALNKMIPLADRSSPKFNAQEATAYLFGDYAKDANAEREATGELADFEKSEADDSGKISLQTADSAKTLVLVLSIAAVVLSSIFAWWLTRLITRPLIEAVDVANKLAGGDLRMNIKVNSMDETGQLLTAMQNMVEKLSSIIGEVRSAADNLSSASEEVSATAQSMSQASNEQAASVEETSASVEQMSASINQNTENAKVTDGMASKAAKEATEGGESVKQTVAAMKQIANKISIIDDIAYQTNLLALNAAIEAARAGEHGKGFAVVAAEVRKLAERSQVAAQEIGEVASSSVDLAERAGKLLDEMVPSINKTSDLVQEITAASEEQSSSVGQINTAMEQLNQITQQNASASEELAATAEEMSGQAEQLQHAMEFFKVDISAIDNQQRTVARKAPASASERPTAQPVKLATAFHSASFPNKAEFVKF